MLHEAFRDMGDGIYIQSRHTADIFNVAHFRPKNKTIRILMRELLFAIDKALIVHSAEEMQKIVDAFCDASKKFGMKINIKKTEVLYQPNSTRTREDDIMVDGNKLNSVQEFNYLGSTISSNGCIDDELQTRMVKASAYLRDWARLVAAPVTDPQSLLNFRSFKEYTVLTFYISFYECIKSTLTSIHGKLYAVS